MGHPEIFLKASLNSTLYVIKSIILLAKLQILQAVYHTLPHWIALQQQQVFFHELHLIELFHEDQVPEKE